MPGIYIYISIHSYITVIKPKLFPEPFPHALEVSVQSYGSCDTKARQELIS